MAKKRELVLNSESIQKIESVLSKDKRAEVIPTKDGIRVIEITRHEAKLEK